MFTRPALGAHLFTHTNTHTLNSHVLSLLGSPTSKKKKEKKVRNCYVWFFGGSFSACVVSVIPDTKACQTASSLPNAALGFPSVALPWHGHSLRPSPSYCEAGDPEPTVWSQDISSNDAIADPVWPFLCPVPLSSTEVFVIGDPLEANLESDD